jgi:hypothetical protein
VSLKKKKTPKLVWQERYEYLTEIVGEYNACQNHRRERVTLINMTRPIY